MPRDAFTRDVPRHALPFRKPVALYRRDTGDIAAEARRLHASLDIHDVRCHFSMHTAKPASTHRELGARFIYRRHSGALSHRMSDDIFCARHLQQRRMPDHIRPPRPAFSP